MADSQLCTILLVVACLLHLGNASRPHMEHALREHDDVPALTSAPWFCHDIDCPKYTVVNTSTDYEVGDGPQTVAGHFHREALPWDSRPVCRCMHPWDRLSGQQIPRPPSHNADRVGVFSTLAGPALQSM